MSILFRSSVLIKRGLTQSVSKRLFATTISFHNNQVVEEPKLSNENTSSTPTTKIHLSKLDKYLVKKFSNTRYESINDVPDSLSATQVNYARDKGRARATIFLIGFTIFASICIISIAKHDKKSKTTYQDDLMQQHAAYSKSHQEAIKSNYK